MSPYSLLTTPLEDKRNSALFILKSKVMYKIPQVHLEHLIEDITGLLERKVCRQLENNAATHVRTTTNFS